MHDAVICIEIIETFEDSKDNFADHIHANRSQFNDLIEGSV
jgi:hypothetical protein